MDEQSNTPLGTIILGGADLVSQLFEFLRPGLQVRQRVSDLGGLLPHAPGSVLDAGQ